MSQSAVPEQNDRVSKHSSQRVLVVTDHRFRRNEIGSHARIFTLTRYLQTQGCEVQLAFMGRMYSNELRLIANSDIEVRPALGLSTHTSSRESESSELHAWEWLRRKAKRCLRVAADVAHVGVDHNVLEPLGFDKPVTVSAAWNRTYPSFPVYEMLRRHDVLTEAADARGLAAAWGQCMSHGSAREAVRERASAVLAGARGATDRHLQAMAPLLTALRRQDLATHRDA